MVNRKDPDMVRPYVADNEADNESSDDSSDDSDPAMPETPDVPDLSGLRQKKNLTQKALSALDSMSFSPSRSQPAPPRGAAELYSR